MGGTWHRPVELIENEADNSHCLQASFRMVWKAFHGIDPGFEEAERLTGYVSGYGTWQFRMMLAFAKSGLAVTDHELFDPHAFIDNPERTIIEQVGDPKIGAVNVADTNIPLEVEAVQECLANPRISFVTRIPGLENMAAELRLGKLLLCNVNSNKLRSLDGYRGHMVVLDHMQADSLRIQNPGPPPLANHVVPRDQFLGAWMDPSPKMANFIAVGYPSVLGM